MPREPREPRELQEESPGGPALVLREMLGRAPMTPADLLRELNQAGWPRTCYVHPLDFLALAPYLSGLKDEDGLYYLVANVVVRPKGDLAGGGDLDLVDWSPPRIFPARSMARD